MTQPIIIGIGGTTRPGSSTENAIRWSLGVCEGLGATTVQYTGADLASLPFYAPEHSTRTEEAARFIGDIRRADGLIIGSPGYHGSVSGLVKNALDYTEDLRDDTRVYLSGMPVGCVATGLGWQATVTTLEALRAITHALRGWPTPLGASINTSGTIFDDAGSVVDDQASFQLRVMAQQVMEFVNLRAPERIHD
jgi:FMN reductase